VEVQESSNAVLGSGLLIHCQDPYGYPRSKTPHLPPHRPHNDLRRLRSHLSSPLALPKFHQAAQTVPQRHLQPPSLHLQPPRRKPGFPTTTTSTAGTLSSPFVSGRDGPSQPMLSALNSKLCPRNSSGALLQYVPQVPANKTGPQRTTRTAQELRLLPSPENDGEDEESGREAYSQFTRIKDPTARRMWPGWRKTIG